MNRRQRQSKAVIEQREWHDKAYKYLDMALECDMKKQTKTALQYYYQGTRALEHALAQRSELTQSELQAGAQELDDKMRRNLAAVQQRVRELELDADMGLIASSSSNAAATRNTPASTSARSQSNSKLPQGLDKQLAHHILNEVLIEKPNVTWSDVVGLSAAKSALTELVILPSLRPDLYTGLRAPARGLLLFGPPGTGKTLLAKALAHESKSRFFAISAASLVSKWMGEGEKLVRTLFTLAKEVQPSVIFMDEVDSMLSARGE